jgi:hypothetical protein
MKLIAQICAAIDVVVLATTAKSPRKKKSSGW